MNPRPSLLDALAAPPEMHEDPLPFVQAVLARAAAEDYALEVYALDVPFRYAWQWKYLGINCELQREVLSTSKEEVRLRACVEFCRARGWPLAYSPREHIHFDIEVVPPTAGQMRAAGAYVPPHVRDFELVEGVTT